MLLQRVHQARLAQARLADEQDDLTHALLGLLPALLQQADLVVAAGQRREPGRPRRLDRALAFADALHLEELDGLRHPLELSRAEAGALELAPDQPVGGLATNDLAGRGDVLQPDGHVPRLPHQRNRFLLRLDDGRTGVKADPRVQLQLVFAAELLAEGLQVLEEAEAGPCGAACAVLVSHRVAEAHQQTLLVALHDRPVKPAHRLLAGLLEGPQHLGLILRVELQIRLGLKQVAAADQDGHLAALGLAGAAPGRGRLRGIGWRRGLRCRGELDGR